MNGTILTRNFAAMKRLLAVSILALLVMAWTACDGPAPTPTTLAPTPTPPPTPTVAPTPEPEPAAAGEQIEWTPCGSLECGSIQVPADYRDPGAGSIRIAVNVHRATSPDNRIGYLFVNPGGPGGSGVKMAFDVALGGYPDEILERFDIVGFDPRGVGLSDELVANFDKAGFGDFSALVGGGSEPEFACGGPGEQLALLASIAMPIDTPEEIAIGEAAANLCIESMGPMGGRLHSEYVANDMDEIRKALGAEQISYLGFSYGSALGVWYATLFPDSVRAMAVDGALNRFPSDPDQPERAPEPEELTRGDATGLAIFEARIEAALAACADPECPIYNDGDPVGYFKQAAAKIDLVNAASGNHPHAGFYGVFVAAAREDGWPDLWQGLFELYENDDPDILLKYARKERYIRALGAGFNDHVNCLDDWVVDPENDRAARLEQEAKAFANESKGEEKYPLLWSIPAPTLPEACTFYDQFAPEPFEGPFDGGGVPILVVGNHDDPRTQFSESEELATDVLSNGYLVETSHYKHGVYPLNQCVNDHIHRALIDGELPDERRVFCEEDRTFAPEPEPAAATGERIDWTPCGPLECGSVQVPADYRDPEAGSIKIAVMVHRATSPEKRIGYLFINPGGPGGSGLEYAFAAAQGKFSDEIVERFDILGFDPRGVGLTDDLVAGLDKIGLDPSVFGGGSGPDFACGEPGEQLALLASIDMPIDTPEEIAAGEAAANLCIQSMGPVGALLGSAYVAYDMDEIRKALGAEQVSYYGGSYGSRLGVWYATLFPKSVRAMVVDGASNPVEQATTQQERVDGKVEEELAAETLLEQALTACADVECPIYNDGDPVGYFYEAVTKLGLVNVAMDNNPGAGLFGVISTLYSQEKWPDLWQGLFELNENDDPSVLRKSAEFQFQGRDPAAARFPDHVNCLDQWSLHPGLGRSARLDDAERVVAAFEERLPLLAVLGYVSFPTACPFYDQFAPAPLEGPLDGRGVPILVIGNHSDPATSFNQSEELVTKTLSNGYLVETSHFKHIVYPGNNCVNSHVHRALIDGELPDERRVFCEEDRTFAPTPTAVPEPAAAGERIDWNPCGPLECGSILVPADYRDPEADSIKIAVAVHRATTPEKRIGYLLVNPGGPGSSGVALSFGAPVGQFSDEIVERFDIVGFDPRGVGLSDELVAHFDKAGFGDLRELIGGGSEPEFACGSYGEQLKLLTSIDGAIDTPEEIAAGEAAANLCIQSMGPVGGLLHSAYVAYDMDEIRQALGADQISYFGASYGSALGVWYATLFPDSVRAMVVDGASNPVEQATTQQERVASEIQGEWTPFETLLEQALTACAADPQCPIYNYGNPVGYFKQAAAKLGLVNAAAGNNPVVGTWGVVSTLYSEKGWPDLWQGLFELNENDDPSILLKYAEKQFPDQGPTAASFRDHVNCLDNWSLHPELARSPRLNDAAGVAAAFKERLPLLAVLRSYSWLADACPFYDQFAPAPLEGPLDGGGVPILVIGNHSDPATPFNESEELVTETLSNGYLVETSRFKHIVYPDNQCVNEHVHRALIDGELPSEQRVFCEEDRTFAPAPEPETASAG